MYIILILSPGLAANIDITNYLSWMTSPIFTGQRSGTVSLHTPRTLINQFSQETLASTSSVPA